MIKKSFNKRILILWAVVLMTVFTALGAVFANASTDTTRPTIISISPINNGLNVETHDAITVRFSEPMDASTINKNTFIVMQRTTPTPGSLASEYRSQQVEGAVTYNDLTATFTPKSNLQANPLQPSQEFGNVFTVTVTDGVKDFAGNSLSRDYMWSFTTGISSFNTGATTSQQDQSAIPVVSTTVPVTQPPASAAVVPVTTTTATNNLSWIWWIVGAAFLLLVIALIVSAINTTSQKSSRITRASPFGDVHPVMAIEGIGQEYSKKLHTMGIKNTKQLWAADAVKVAQKTGAPLGSVRGWQQMAELASVKDIGPQYAELLERSGVHSIDQLKNSDTDRILRMINHKQDSLKVNIQGNSPGHATVEHWISEARDHKFTESVVGQTA